MKIDYSKWIIRFSDGSGSATIENPTEGIQWYLYFNTYTLGSALDPRLSGDDTLKFIKERAKQEIRSYYFVKQLEYMNGKTIPVEDNLDYCENEAERRGLKLDE